MKAQIRITLCTLSVGLLWSSAGCTKEDGPLDENLVGRWTLTGRNSGWGGYIATNPAKPEAIEFDAKGRVFYFENNTQTRKATYRLKTNSEPNANIDIRGGGGSQVYSIHGDSLVIGAPNNTYDGSTYFYCRVCAGSIKK